MKKPDPPLWPRAYLTIKDLQIARKQRPPDEQLAIDAEIERRRAAGLK